MDEKLYNTLKSFGIDPSLVIPPNSAVEILDSTELNETIIQKVGVEKGRKILEELKKAEQVHSLMKAKKVELIPVEVWVRDPRVRSGGYYATRYVKPRDAVSQVQWDVYRRLLDVKGAEKSGDNKKILNALKRYEYALFNAISVLKEVQERAKKTGDDELVKRSKSLIEEYDKEVKEIHERIGKLEREMAGLPVLPKVIEEKRKGISGGAW
jgi:hypothetical protein